MRIKILTLWCAALLALAACVPHVSENGAAAVYVCEIPYPTSDLCLQEEALAMGWSQEEIDAAFDAGISLENIMNQARFAEFTDAIYNNRPIGASGQVIAPQYHGGLYFNAQGILTIMVLDGAFNHEPSATAIEEMRELGMAVVPAAFTHQALQDVSDALFELWDEARAAGLSSSGIGAENRITAWLDPYSAEQKAVFTEFLRSHGFNPAMFILSPAVTDEMRDARAASIAAAIQSGGGQLAPIGAPTVSRTGIIFTLENRTNMDFSYGSPFDIAYYEDGEWRPVPHLSGAGGGPWTLIGFFQQAGGAKESRQDWQWWFGALPPGRYMFIRDGWQIGRASCRERV